MTLFACIAIMEEHLEKFHHHSRFNFDPQMHKYHTQTGNEWIKSNNTPFSCIMLKQLLHKVFFLPFPPFYTNISPDVAQNITRIPTEQKL